jgi:hypothetical protein
VKTEVLIAYRGLAGEDAECPKGELRSLDKHFLPDVQKIMFA